MPAPITEPTIVGNPKSVPVPSQKVGIGTIRLVWALNRVCNWTGFCMKCKNPDWAVRREHRKKESREAERESDQERGRRERKKKKREERRRRKEERG